MKFKCFVSFCKIFLGPTCKTSSNNVVQDQNSQSPATGMGRAGRGDDDAMMADTHARLLCARDLPCTDLNFYSCLHPNTTREINF